jgi:hypothetical protein
VEAASPALIEQVRTAISDGAGQYRIENLRPGVYSVAFTLPGFSTVRREGVELTGSFVATVNAELPLGALEETVTVSGETPTVDVQSVARQTVFNKEVLETVPVNRMPAFIAALTPGVNVSTTDVGGNLGPSPTGGSLNVHGSRTTDLLVMGNGLTLQTVVTGSAPQSVVNMAAYQEITVDTAAGDAQYSLGGVRMNLIPAEGSNVLRGSFTGNFANTSMQGSNYTAALEAAGLRTPNRLHRIWDLNPSLGGPIKQNQLWFFATGRHTGAWNYAGIFANANAGNQGAWSYVPDTSKEPEATQLNTRTVAGRLTWQATPISKFSGSYEYSGQCACNSVSATISPEAASNVYYDPKSVATVDWAAPLTNRLLLDANFLYLNQYRIADDANSSAFIRVTEQSTGLSYRGKTSENENITIQYEYRASLSYVTGSHAFKTGFNDMQASASMYTYLVGPPLAYRFNNGVANQFTQFALPSTSKADLDHDLGIFAQDKWTRGRLTLSGGIRFDYFRTSFPQLTIGPSLYTPNRNITTPATLGVSWKDITPRTGLAYDVFGNGKTAVKVGVNKYVAGQALRGAGGTTLFGSDLAPTNLLVSSTARNWTDSNANFVVDCDLTNMAAQNRTALGGDNCGAGNVLFGTNRVGATYDPEILRGWGRRAYNWELSAGMQQEILPRTSLDVSVFHRSFHNQAVTDNLRTTATDYDRFTITVPSDSRLPEGGGYQVTGVDVTPALFNVIENFNTFANHYGEVTERWGGVDVSINARPRPGLLLSGGVSTGRSVFDNCEVVQKLPEVRGTLPAQYCRQQEPLLTQVKFIGSYVVPRIDVQVSGTLQSLPGAALIANFVATNAMVAPSLGRSLSGNAQNVTIQILEPSALYGDRRNQLDLRVGKILRIDQRRFVLGLEVANAFNANPVLTRQAAYATWLTPQTILTARFAKVWAQIDF